MSALVIALLYWHPWQRPITIITRINLIDGAVMVYVPAGKFRMGKSNGPEAREEWRKKEWGALGQTLLRTLRGEAVGDAQPVHTVYLDAYWIYKNDVTVAQYRHYCTAMGLRMPLTPRWGWKDDHPMIFVTWQESHDYAKWAGAALPTEAQWEKAARGTDGRIYPWGNDWDAAECSNSVGSNAGQISPVGSYPAGTSPYGCLDMAGNVWQWCADWYAMDYYQQSPARNPLGPVKGAARVLRGGSWGLTYPTRFSVSFRNSVTPWFQHGEVGFRCVLRAPSP